MGCQGEFSHKGAELCREKLRPTRPSSSCLKKTYAVCQARARTRSAHAARAASS